MTSKIATFALVGALLLSVAAAEPQGGGGGAFADLKAKAETFRDEKSFSRAHEVYEEAAKLQLSGEDRRWVEMRLADTAWRDDAASPAADGTVRDEARAALEELIRKTPQDGHDRVWAEANESLGDYHATHPYSQNIYGAKQYYVAALDWWAGSDSIDLARQRYLDLVWHLTLDGQIWNAPGEVLVNAVAIARSDEDRAHARFLLASQLFNEGTPQSIERALELIDEVAREGKKSEWLDDALYLGASQLAAGRAAAPANDEEPRTNYARALELFRRITTEFKPDQTKYYDPAKRAIEEIISPAVGVQVGSTFLPGSEQEIVVNWRNIREVVLAFHPVDLTKSAQVDRSSNWVDDLRLDEKVERQWTLATNDRGDHSPGVERIRIQPRVAPGAYVLTASAGSRTARQLFLVTDAHILLHAGPGKGSLFVSDVVTGEPIANARVHVWHRGQHASEETASTDANGLAQLKEREPGTLLVTVASGTSRQAFLQTYNYASNRPDEAQWRIYAFTDRPAYRPNETVEWKIIARVRDDQRWSTPPQETLGYEIVNPRGEKVASGSAKLNDFGSFWSDLPLTESMPLGAYRISFTVGDRGVASADLFRLEEYKLPEFKVSVATPEGKQYRLGDTVEASIQADYYFGGPVANAEVEAVVYQRPFVRYWYPWRKYSWYWDETSFAPQQGEAVMTRQTLRTDQNGRAVVKIETPRDGVDTSYRIEARVVDASRREVRGEGSVRVGKQRYAVLVAPDHFLHRPGEKASVRFRAVDANDKPVATTGTVKVVRRSWREHWIDRYGVRVDAGIYDEEETLTTKLDTDARGEATLTFTPRSVGYYAIRWTSSDGDSHRARDVVSAETTLWVAERTTNDLGYHAGGLDIIVDKETARVGEAASIMIVTPASGRWVVLTSSADEILDTQVLHLDGTVKLVHIPIDDRHVPNFFIDASSIYDRQLATDRERIVVPPDAHFLTVDVKADREEYEPRQEGTVTVTTRDAEGKPVAAEVALAVSDEAVTAIQEDMAGDPRQFFYGDVRWPVVRVAASLQSQQYSKLVVGEKNEIYDEREKDQRKKGQNALAAAIGGEGMVGGRSYAVQESIVVSAEAPTLQKAAMAAPAPASRDLGEPSAVQVEVRTDFRSTALWKPDVVTGADGTATVKVRYPEALTTWRTTARAATTGSQFGMGSSTAKTNLPLIVRLEGPRFFVAGDRAVVSAVINNRTDEMMTVTPAIEVEGLATSGTAPGTVRVDAHGEARAEWSVVAAQAGTAKLRVSGRSSRYGDAMEKSFVVYEHGIDKLIAKSGKLRGDEAVVRLDLPRERRATDLTVQIAPSLAVTMLDALPYLIDYPYGCTEQTMSRFLPAAIVARTIEKLGIPRSRLTSKAGMKNLDSVTAKGMARLYDMQHPDGGWGWWKTDDSDEFMTAYVVWGFAVARDGGLEVRTDAVNQAAEWLEHHLVLSENRWSDQAWMLHALSAWSPKIGQAERRAYDDVWAHRDRLTAYSRALLALTAHRYGDAERAAVLVRNLEDGAVLDRTPDSSVLLEGETAAETMATVHWGERRFWWHWYDGPVETTAFVLQALVTIDPHHRLVEPAMNWLVKNRRGAQWNNTRDTAITVLAFDDYLQRSGELSGDVGYELTVNGKTIASKTLTAAEVLGAPSRFTIDPSLLGETMQEIRIRRTKGTAPIYFSAEGRFVSLEEPIKAAGNEIFVRREYFRLVPHPTLLKGVLYDKVPLRDGDSVPSGDRIEVVVTIDVKNDYDYLLFEDLKPAGFEAVALRSGEPLWATGLKTSRSASVYQELRDRKVAMFIDHLQQGLWEIHYTLRAETPGTFHALPLLGQAMYVPEIRANGDEVRVTVGD